MPILYGLSKELFAFGKDEGHAKPPSPPRKVLEHGVCIYEQFQPLGLLSLCMKVLFWGEPMKAFRLVDCQVGAVFAINGEVVGLECFGYQQTFGKFFQKLVQSYALDAMDWLKGGDNNQVSIESVRRFLEDVQNAPGKPHPSLGLGENIRLENDFVTGAALVYEEKVLHLSAFCHNRREDDHVKVPFQRFFQRMKRI